MKIDIVPFAEAVCQRKLGVHHAIVHCGDDVAAAFHFQPTDRRCEIHSATKSVVGLAAGMAMDEGLFTLETHPADVYKRQLCDPAAGRDRAHWEKRSRLSIYRMSRYISLYSSA